MRGVLKTACVLTAAMLAACGGGGADDPGTADAPTAVLVDRTAVSLDPNDYPVFPNADAGADPGVSAEDGGAGFTGEGWETNVDFDLIGDPRAVRGGVFREAVRDYPATLRYIGPNLSVWNQTLHGLVYESLLGLHPTTLEYIPSVATHWQILDDGVTFRFRLNPNARFSDGASVTAEDVVATWRLMVDPSVQDPFRNALYSGFEEPVAESSYIVRVRALEPGWTGFYYFSGLPVYPAHVLNEIDGETYVRDYNNQMLPGTGPYLVHPEGLDPGNSITISRRDDYWAEDARASVGTGNFDEIEEIVVRDQNLEFEMVRRGDLDYFRVTRAQMWYEELEFEEIQRGLMQKRKIWNHAPQSIQGIAFNMRRPPYDEPNVRQALRHLFNREQMLEQLMFNEYIPQDSVYPGTIYANPDNEVIAYDPAEAVRLLAEAGWSERNAQGQLVRDGVPLNLELLYYDRGSERFFTIFQEDLRRVGIGLNLRFVTPETGFGLLDEFQFGMFSVAYGGGGPFPLPEQFWSSVMADQRASTNVTGFKNERVDEIIAEYEREFEVSRRATLLRELDGIVTDVHPFILEWYAPFERIVYWNKFGQPDGLITRIGDYRDPLSLWWFDPARDQQLQVARDDDSIQLEAGESDDRYWLEFARVEEQQNPNQ